MVLLAQTSALSADMYIGMSPIILTPRLLAYSFSARHSSANQYCSCMMRLTVSGDFSAAVRNTSSGSASLYSSGHSIKAFPPSFSLIAQYAAYPCSHHAFSSQNASKPLSSGTSSGSIRAASPANADTLSYGEPPSPGGFTGSTCHIPKPALAI